MVNRMKFEDAIAHTKEMYKESLQYLSVTDTQEYDDFCEMLVKSNPDMCRTAVLFHAREKFIKYKESHKNV